MYNEKLVQNSTCINFYYAGTQINKQTLNIIISIKSGESINRFVAAANPKRIGT